MAIQVVLPDTQDQWAELEKYLVNLYDTSYDDYLEMAAAYGKASLYFMMWHILKCARWKLPDFECKYWKLPYNTRVMEHPYCFDFIHETEKAWDEHGNNGVFLECARGFIKTTTACGIITQDICKDSDTCWLILSENKVLAKAKYRRCKDEIGDNHLLKALYPDIFYENPERDSGSIFTEEYLTVRRESARAEHTIICKGLERRLPTGDHYSRMYIDDVVNEDSSNTPEMRALIENNFRSAMNLRDNYFFKYIASGTPYHFDDLNMVLKNDGTYSKVIRRPAEDLLVPPTLEERKIFPAIRGKPVFLGPQLLMTQYRAKKASNYDTQMRLDPTGGKDSVFEKSFLLRYSDPPSIEARKYNCHILIVVDPSSGRKKDTADLDPCAICSIGIGWDGIWRILDIKLDKFDPEEKAYEVIDMAQRWHKSGIHPVLEVICEEVGQSSDVFWIRKKMAEKGVHFRVRAITNVGQGVRHVGRGMGKQWMIKEYLVPMFKERQWKVPSSLKIKSCHWKGRKNVIDDYLWPKEMATFGFSKDDHVLDCLKLPFLPRKSKNGKMKVPVYQSPNKMNQYHSSSSVNTGSWMSL